MSEGEPRRTPGAGSASRASSWAVVALVAAVLTGACASKAPPTASPALAASAETEADGGAPDASDDAASDDAGADETETAEASGPCPADMSLVAFTGEPSRRFCIDKYEASLVEVLGDGSEQAFPHYVPVDGHDVRAVSRPGVFPQGYISELQAQDACAASSKRLCNLDEWKTACMGPAHTTFPYGEARRPGVCHDTGKSAVVAVFGAKAVAASTPAAPPPPAASAAGKRASTTKGRAAQTTHARPTARTAAASRATTASKTAASKAAAAKAAAARKVHGKPARKSTRPASVDPGVWAKLNDPALGQVEGALSKTGDHAECVNDFGVFDMVGNLHEWVATDPAAPRGAFAGGYYLDTTINGDGCNYKTGAHAHDYHDYSTGFRCCAATSE